MEKSMHARTHASKKTRAESIPKPKPNKSKSRTPIQSGDPHNDASVHKTRIRNTQKKKKKKKKPFCKDIISILSGEKLQRPLLPMLVINYVLGSAD